jgi:hypothetical protein
LNKSLLTSKKAKITKEERTFTKCQSIKCQRFFPVSILAGQLGRFPADFLTKDETATLRSETKAYILTRSVLVLDLIGGEDNGVTPISLRFCSRPLSAV